MTAIMTKNISFTIVISALNRFQTSCEAGESGDQPEEEDVDEHLRLLGRRLQTGPGLHFTNHL